MLTSLVRLCTKFKVITNPGGTTSGDLISKDFHHLPPPVQRVWWRFLFSKCLFMYSSNIYSAILPMLLGRPGNESRDPEWSVGHQPHHSENSLENMALGLYLSISEIPLGAKVGYHCQGYPIFTKNPSHYQFGNTGCEKGSNSTTWILCWFLT